MSKTEDSYIEIPTPDGFQPPEGTEEGKDFTVLFTVSQEGDHLCLKKADGIELSGSQSTESKSEQKKEDKSAQKSVGQKFMEKFKAGGMKGPQGGMQGMDTGVQATGGGY